MNRRNVALLLSGIVLVIILGFIFLPYMMDETRQGRLIASELANATGQRIRIEGPISVSVLPSPRINIGNLKIIALDGRTLLLEAPTVGLKVGLFSLLKGKPVVHEIALDRPRIFFARAENGTLNWNPNFAKAGALSVRHTSISDGQIVFKNGDQLENFTSVYGNLHLPDDRSYLRAKGTATWRTSPVGVELNLSSPLGDGASPVAIKAEIGAASASLTAAGTYNARNPSHPLSINATAEVGKTKILVALATAAGLFETLPQDPALDHPFKLNTTLSGENGRYTLDTFTAALGPYTWKGTARIQTSPRLGLSIAAQGNRLDLAGWTSLTGGIKSGTLAIPKNWLLAFQLDFPAVTYGAVVANNVSVLGDINNGILRLAEGSATLPGESRLSVKGIFTTEKDKPIDVDTNISLDTVRLRDLLGGLGLTPPKDIDQGTLSQIQFVASVRGAWGNCSLPAFHLTLDGMDMSGQVAAADENGVFNATLGIDSLDLNRYLAQANPDSSSEGQALSSVGQALSGEMTVATPRPFLPAWLWTLPRTNLDLTVKQLRMGEFSAQSVNLRALLLPNLLTITSLDTPDFGGNRLRLSGSYSPDKNVDSDIALSLSTDNFPRLRTSFLSINTLLPAPLLSLIDGAADIVVRWRTTAQEQQLLQSISASSTRLDLVTTLRENETPRWKARLTHPESTVLLQKLAPALVSNPNATLGALDLYAEGQQDGATGGWTLSSIQGQGAGLNLRSGTLAFEPVPASSPLPLRIMKGALTIANGSLDLVGEAFSPFGLGRFIQGTTAFSIERLTVANDVLTDATATLTLREDGTISLDALSGNWRKGTLTAKGEAANTGDRPIKGEFHLQDATFNKSYGSRIGLSGDLDFSLRFETSGITPEARRQNLRGDGEFTLSGGNFNGLDLDLLATKLTAALKNSKTTNVDDILDRGGTTDLASFGGNIALEEGVATLQNASFKSLKGTASLTKAEIDLKASRLDTLATVTLEKPKDAPPFTFSLYGGLDNIRAMTDSAALANWLQEKLAPRSAEGEAKAEKTDGAKTDEAKTDGEKPNTAKEAKPKEETNATPNAQPRQPDEPDDDTQPKIIKPRATNPELKSTGTDPSAAPIDKPNPFLPPVEDAQKAPSPKQPDDPSAPPPTMQEFIGKTTPTTKPDEQTDSPPPNSPTGLLDRLFPSTGR